MIEFDYYQRATRITAIYPDSGHRSAQALTYLALGLTSEAGEVAGGIKKRLRDGELDEAAVRAELGDVLWYLARLADELGTDLGNVAEANLAKLFDRKARGVIGGNGDQR